MNCICTIYVEYNKDADKTDLCLCCSHMALDRFSRDRA